MRCEAGDAGGHPQNPGMGSDLDPVLAAQSAAKGNGYPQPYTTPARLHRRAGVAFFPQGLALAEAMEGPSPSSTSSVPSAATARISRL